MKILVLNWGIAEEYSWHHSLLKEMAALGANITVVSAVKAWAPRGGKLYPEEETHDGLHYLRMFSSISDFKNNLIGRMSQVLDKTGRVFDIVWTFHQANWVAGDMFRDVLGCKHVLVCEQAFRTSGLHSGLITERWKEIQERTDLIISWAPQDKKNEEAIGVKYLPFGGCYPGIEEKVVPWGLKWEKSAYAIYQGSVAPHFKNQQAMAGDISRILDSQVVENFVLNGQPVDDAGRRIIDELKNQWGDRFHYSMLVGRDAVIQSLRRAVFGYSPMKPDILSNFPFEAFGVGVPMYMPYIENPPGYVETNWKKLCKMIMNRSAYEAQVTKGRGFYDLNLSTEVMGLRYFNALEGVL